MNSYQGESNSESGWCVARLSATLSACAKPRNIKQAVLSSLRRQVKIFANIFHSAIVIHILFFLYFPRIKCCELVEIDFNYLKIYMQEPCVPAVPALGPEYGGVAGRGRSPARRSSPSSQGASQASLVVKEDCPLPAPRYKLITYN